MQEVGIDLSVARSKHVDEFAGQAFDLVVTVCDNARETCPIFPGAKQKLHWPFDDPASTSGTSVEQLRVFRQVRDQITSKVQAFLCDIG
jgi:arsenate reductase